MEVISSVFSLGVTISGYDERVLAELLRKQHPDKIFVTEIWKDEFNTKNPHFSTYKAINEIIGSELKPVGVNTTKYEKFKDTFLQENLRSPEQSIKKNMLDLIENTIANYLAQYWKSPETVNSEVTDSLFRAKHKLLSSVFYDLEAGYWDERNQQILENIQKDGPTENSVILCSVESRYWFKDHIKDLYK